ncbi:MAG: lysophospholipid acyltransferase family protein [Myxococcales bacterium]|jgi:1-acyl-sn-glycerol-3-phosphate acyltransferase
MNADRRRRVAARAAAEPDLEPEQRPSQDAAQHETQTQAFASRRGGAAPDEKANGKKAPTARPAPKRQPAKKAAARRPAAKRSVAKKPTARRPAARKPQAERPAAGRGSKGATGKAERTDEVSPQPEGKRAETAVSERRRGGSRATFEQDLATLLSDVDGAEGDAEARRRAAEAIARIAARLHPEESGESDTPTELLQGARQLLSSDYYFRQWGRLGMRGRSERVDDFGLDPTYEARVQSTLDALYDKYFRVQVTGAEHLPDDGAALLVCNHSGALPWDGVMLKTAVRREHPKRRGLRWLIEDFTFHAPFLGAFLNRIGAVRACQENAQRLLSQGELLAVFPEGVKGIDKPYKERYRLQRFGRGGHVKLALRMGVPLIPVAIVGAEETYPLVGRVRSFSKALGLPFIPVTPTFPLLGPLGLVPLPSRWHIAIGAPLRELEDLDPAAATDAVLVNELNERVRNGVGSLLQDALRARGPNAYL